MEPKQKTSLIMESKIVSKQLKVTLTEITSLTNALEISEPEYIFHLAAQSFVPRSFENSPETQMINCIGTANLLDAARIKDSDTKIVFAGSSEEYGLVISSEDQYKHAKKEYGTIFPEPVEYSRSSN